MTSEFGYSKAYAITPAITTKAETTVAVSPFGMNLFRLVSTLLNIENNH